MKHIDLTMDPRWIVPFSELSVDMAPEVGEANAAQGTLRHCLAGSGVAVLDGFAVTTAAYRHYVRYNGLHHAIAARLRHLDDNGEYLSTVGAAIRATVMCGEMPPDLYREIERAYMRLSANDEVPLVALSPSMPAGQPSGGAVGGRQETRPFVRGADKIAEYCIACFASLYADDAIARRMKMEMPQHAATVAVGVQRVPSSDAVASGTANSIDTETGFPDVVLVKGVWGLDAADLNGAVEPDEIALFKPLLGSAHEPILTRRLGEKRTMKIAGRNCDESDVVVVPVAACEQRSFVLDDNQLCGLASAVARIEAHFGCPIEAEWLLDGGSGTIHIAQTRPESRRLRLGARTSLNFRIDRKGATLTSGIAIGHGAAAGTARKMTSIDDADLFEEGDVLVTEFTDPDWLPVIRRAAAVITDRGGRSGHAGVVCRQLKIPAVVGTGDGSMQIANGRQITVACCDGSVGRVYDGIASILGEEIDPAAIPRTATKVMLDFAEASAALGWWQLPCDGIGLARMESIVASYVRVHPLALTRFDALPAECDKQIVSRLTDGWSDKGEFYVERLAQGIASIAASVWPKPVMVRVGGFEADEYTDLLGGAAFQRTEWHDEASEPAACRFVDDRYRETFALECLALCRVRRDMGFANVHVLGPFCRTPDDGAGVIDALAVNGLRQGQEGLEIHAMCAVPSNVMMVDDFASLFDGFSIVAGDSNRLSPAIDDACAPLRQLFDEDNPAMRRAIKTIIDRAHRNDLPVGACGRGPSENPSFAQFLVAAGIDFISVAPDTFATVKATLRAAESSRRPTLVAAAE